MNGSADALADWIALRGSEAGALFCPVNKGDRIIFRRMADQAVLGIVRKRGEDAGVARFSPHDLRRTFASDLLDAGADLSTTKRLAGNSGETTTGRYDQLGKKPRRRQRSCFMCRTSGLSRPNGYRREIAVPGKRLACGWCFRPGTRSRARVAEIGAARGRQEKISRIPKELYTCNA
jgi:hypothetical protein